ncbi:MAG TPA: GatB/YqeY domain-containing protein [Baekduia sp.]|nr:GatB/YqeY domain-containing protein [Baekduia sp.]
MAEITDTIKQDVTTAMKAGEKERVATLRLVLSELQKDAKEGKGDELAVLRRERKRRVEAAAAFRDGGRDDLAVGEESEASIIETYLPAEIGDDELRQIVLDAIAETGASSPKDMGGVMKAAMAKTQGRADGKRVSALAGEALKA